MKNNFGNGTKLPQPSKRERNSETERVSKEINVLLKEVADIGDRRSELESKTHDLTYQGIAKIYRAVWLSKEFGALDSLAKDVQTFQERADVASICRAFSKNIFRRSKQCATLDAAAIQYALHRNVKPDEFPAWLKKNTLVKAADKFHEISTSKEVGSIKGQMKDSTRKKSGLDIENPKKTKRIPRVSGLAEALIYLTDQIDDAVMNFGKRSEKKFVLSLIENPATKSIGIRWKPIKQ